VERRGVRETVRFRLSAPVIFRWTDQSGTQREDVGRTRDISVAGAFVCSNILPPVKTKLSLDILLPPLESSTFEGLHLKTEGNVARVEERPESGFAIRGQFTLHEA
jgi:hypothetical protein